MKKFSLFLLCVLFLAGVAGCGKSAVTTSDDSSEAESTSSEEAVTSEESDDPNVIKYGEIFSVDVTNIGTVAADAPGTDSNVIVIEGVEYALPVAFSELLANGWSLPDGFTYTDRFYPNRLTRLLGFYLENGSGTRLIIEKALNNTDEVATLEDCLITGFCINRVVYGDATTGMIKRADFILPGGITADSTAANVLEIFGRPKQAEEFKELDTEEDALKYYHHVSSDITLFFYFEANGSLRSFSVTWGELA